MKKYVIRHLDIPLVTLKFLKPMSEGEWYYCNKSEDVFYGCWRHKSEIKHLIVGDLDAINERFNRITGIYKNNKLAIDELTEELSQEFVSNILRGY